MRSTLDQRAAITGRVRKHTRLPLPPEGQAASHLSYLFERGAAIVLTLTHHMGEGRSHSLIPMGEGLDC